MFKHFPILFISAVISTLIITSCGGKPEYIIESQKLKNILVDIHKGEALMESNYTHFNDEMRRDSVKTSILKKHNVTRQQLDTTLLWYGMHVEVYLELYKGVIEQLKGEQDKILALMNEDETVTKNRTQSGDTVDIWNRKPLYIFDSKLSRNTLTYIIPTDDNFKEWDKFVLKFKLGKLLDGESIQPILVTLSAKGLRDSIYYSQKSIDKLGWDSITLQPNEMLRNVKGSIIVPIDPTWTSIYADSITLTRIHTRK